MPGLYTFLKRRRQRLYSSKIMAEDEEEECLRPQTPDPDDDTLPDWPAQRMADPIQVNRTGNCEGDLRGSREQRRHLKKKQVCKKRWSMNSAPRRYFGSLVRWT